MIASVAVVGWVIAVVQALATPWGLVRHYWVLVKLVIITLAFVILF